MLTLAFPGNRFNGEILRFVAMHNATSELREFLEEFWDVRLEALKREAEKEERKKHGRND